MSNPDREHPAANSDEIASATAVETPPAEIEQKLGLSMLIKISLAVLVISSLIIGISCLMKTNQLQQQNEELAAEIAEYEERVRLLRYYLDEEVDDEYIAKIAREYFDMVFPDEDIYYNDVNE